jgi:hypothetical protein
MVARFLYRLVSLFFLALALVSWLMAAAEFVALWKAPGFDVGAFGTATVMPIMAFMMHQCSIEAWRAGRYRRYDPLWRDYP